MLTKENLLSVIAFVSGVLLFVLWGWFCRWIYWVLWGICGLCIGLFQYIFFCDFVIW